jgi:transposase-like protein
MSGRKGMMRYKVEIKQEAVRLVLEEHMTYSAVAVQLEIRKAERIKAWVRMYRREGEFSFHKPIGRPIKAESEEREVERLWMENALLKKFHTELRKVQLAQRNIGRSTTTRKNTKCKQCVNSLRFRERHIMPGRANW